ncbi:MAG: ankyrin repeat domain-containing protein [Treponema sp.]|jgi:hypothetical protein|nr:ankyrin repeat domain-containing protein [Treponema sp.]
MNKIVMVICFCMVCIFGFFSCQRAPVPGFGFGIPFKKVPAEEEAFYYTVILRTVEEIEVFLKDGHDPNFMNATAAIPWYDTNPLWRVCNNYEKAMLFIKYGADVKNRPYLYQIIFATPILSEKHPNENLMENIRTRREDVVYRLIKLFLEAGADPNFKGADGLAPFSFNMDEAYKKYFEKNGKLPINSAIKYSTFTIVDLLLEYGATLDESCLETAKEATERIGNDDMEKYIKALWEKQQNDRSVRDTQRWLTRPSDHMNHVVGQLIHTLKEPSPLRGLIPLRIRGLRNSPAGRNPRLTFNDDVYEVIVEF